MLFEPKSENFDISQNIKFHDNRSSKRHAFPYGQTDRYGQVYLSRKIYMYNSENRNSRDNLHDSKYIILIVSDSLFE
jgi:hypothetical protein